jgi:alpha-tubulin suppressor-like RCC1 family protein
MNTHPASAVPFVAVAILCAAAGCEPDRATSPTGLPNPAASLSRPVAASPGTSTVAPGGFHSCGISPSGHPHCWGQNTFGQIGIGTSGPPNYPSPQATVVSMLFNDAQTADVRVGAWHACARNGIGEVYCWGRNQHGQLGDGSLQTRSVPMPIAGAARFAAISVGDEHTCGLRADGAAYCWGLNADGQLGDGTTEPRSVPTPVQTSARFVAIAAGDRHTCALDEHAAAHCWGRNDRGQLGTGTDVPSPLPVAVSGGHRFRSIAAGRQEHTCAISEAGVPFCWGANSNGQVGDGSLMSRLLVPTLVAGELNLVGITAGTGHTCGISVAGAAHCWGLNIYGQLGTGGTSLLHRTPQAVVPVAPFVEIAAGWQRTCARAADGTAYCWGNNEGGSIGDGTTTTRPSPTPIAAWQQ